MKRLLETSFFALLAEGLGVCFEEERYIKAIREFAGDLRKASEAENDAGVRERMLARARMGLEYWLERVVVDDGALGKKWGLYLLLYSCGVKIGGGRRALVT